MVEFLQFTLSGISFGMIYAAVALSLVLIWRGTRLLNYAQGGMAMITNAELPGGIPVMVQMELRGDPKPMLP